MLLHAASASAHLIPWHLNVSNSIKLNIFPKRNSALSRYLPYSDLFDPRSMTWSYTSVLFSITLLWSWIACSKKGTKTQFRLAGQLLDILTCEVGEGAVALGHLVRVFTLFDGWACAVEGINNFHCYAVSHADTFAVTGCLYEPHGC